MLVEVTNCQLCPRNCHVNRSKEKGFCMAPDKIKIARADLHYFEEPCLTGKTGSGTIFFSHCNLGCIFCQNYQISLEDYGQEISIEKFSKICLELQRKKASNINLVTPTMYVPWIVEGLKKAKEKGLKIPIVYNSSGYENVSTIKSLKGLIDIYLPDLKYQNDFYARKYSKCPNYFKYAKEAIEEMYKQVGKPKFKNGLMTKGVIVRHLVLPGHINDSKNIISYLYNTYKDNIYISIMNQYTPVRTLKYESLNRTVTDQEYDEVINFAYDLGVRKAFMQVGQTQKTSFIPDFKNSKI